MTNRAVRPAAIITDIEGTTTPIAFVHRVLFPYARERLAAFIDANGNDPQVVETLRQTAELSDGQPPIDALRGWMDADAKVTPLKTLQGLIWDEGYRAGDLVGQLYPDVPPMLRRWHSVGLRLYVYSSGSEAAQRLLFGHSQAGNLTSLFSGFFDTRAGAKREAGSYSSIAGAIRTPPAEILFLSDVEQELDAAKQAGVITCQLVRAEDGTVPSARHRTVADFAGLTTFIS